MVARILCCTLGTVLLASPAVAQQKEDPAKAELERLRAQVLALQAQVQALQAKVRVLEDNACKYARLPQLPRQAPPPPAADGDPEITTGVKGLCWYQFIPGVEGAEFPAPTPYEGATIRILSLKDNKVLQEGKTSKSGWFRLAVPPGKYLLEIVPRSKAESVQSPVDVTVEKDKLTSVEITITLSGV